MSCTRGEMACMALILGELAPQILTLDWPKEELRECLDFIRVTERFSQNILIAGSAAVLKSVANVPYSSVVIGMGGNGVEMGIRISQQPDKGNLLRSCSPNIRKVYKPTHQTWRYGSICR